MGLSVREYISVCSSYKFLLFPTTNYFSLSHSFPASLYIPHFSSIFVNFYTVYKLNCVIKSRYEYVTSSIEKEWPGPDTRVFFALRGILTR